MSEQKYQAERRRSDFTIVPNAVLRNGKISGNAKALYAIVLYLDYTGDEPELDELGAMLGGGRKTAQTAIKELADEGLLLTKRRGQGKTNLYRALDPQNVPEGRSREAAEAAPSSKDLQEDRDVEADASTSRGGEVSTRKRNLVFDALVTATNANPASDGGLIGKAAKAIREAMDDTLRELTHGYMAQYPEADEVPADIIDRNIAAEIESRALLYAQLRPDWELTPGALAKHWNRIPTWKPRTGSARLTPAQIARGER